MTKFKNHKEKTTILVKKLGSKAVKLQASSSKHIGKYVTRRASRIGDVRRFVASWLLLVLLLIIGTFAGLMQVRSGSAQSTPVAGGIYTEGMVGEVNNLNPLFSNGMVDDSIGRLLFNGLYRHDEDGKLVPDMAVDYKIDESKKIYTVKLRDDVRWHDSQPLTAEDVVYTIGIIQNPETRSTSFASWQGVKVSQVDKLTVKFELPAPFAPFPGALTVPILPSHLLKEIPANKIRTTSFNTNPVGTGPFIFKALRSESLKQRKVEFTANKSYFRGSPKLDGFVIHLYPEDESLAGALKAREITAAVDLKSETAASFRSDKSIRFTDIPLNSGVFAFYKNTSPILTDEKVRRALTLSVNRETVLSLFDSRYAPLKTPLLPSQLGYDARFNQITNLQEASRLLDEAGWVKQPNGIRAKDGTSLELNMITVNSAQYSAMAGSLQKQWAAIGVKVNSQLLILEQLQQNGLSAHSYDILLYGISIGYDPDVYAYWHSSQARSGGLNFSEWKSSRADSSLEVARTRLEDVLRKARYETFLDEWQKSSPAVALYIPRVIYAYHQNAQGIMPVPSNNASDRLTNVEDWTVITHQVNRTP